MNKYCNNSEVYESNCIPKTVNASIAVLTPKEDKDFIELMLLTDAIEEYENVHYPIATPSLTEVIKLRMFEMNLTQAKLAELLGVSAPRISEYLSGRSEPTLKVARNIHHKLNISPSIILQ